MVEKEPSTLFFQAPKVVLFVDVGAAIVDAAEKGCDPIRVLRADTPTDAMRMIVELHPLLILLGESVSAAENPAGWPEYAATSAASPIRMMGAPTSTKSPSATRRSATTPA